MSGLVLGSAENAGRAGADGSASQTQYAERCRLPYEGCCNWPNCRSRAQEPAPKSGKRIAGGGLAARREAMRAQKLVQCIEPLRASIHLEDLLLQGERQRQQLDQPAADPGRGLVCEWLRHVRGRQADLNADTLPATEIADVAASFQRRVVETLIDRTFAAARWHGAKAIGIAGGVSANSRLRREALAKSERSEIPVYIPSLALSTDNAAMIAAAGMRQLAAGRVAPDDLNAAASLPL